MSSTKGLEVRRVARCSATTVPDIDALSCTTTSEFSEEHEERGLSTRSEVNVKCGKVEPTDSDLAAQQASNDQSPVAPKLSTARENEDGPPQKRLRSKDGHRCPNGRYASIYVRKLG